MFLIKKSLGFCGYGSAPLPTEDIELNALRQKICDTIVAAIEQGTNIFYLGFQHPFELLCNEILWDLKQLNGSLTLVALLPQHLSTNDFYRKLSSDNKLILDNCTQQITLQNSPTYDWINERDDFLISGCLRIATYYNENEHDSSYFRSHVQDMGITVINLNM